MKKVRATRHGLLLLLFTLAANGTFAATQQAASKTGVEFRREVYESKTKEQLPYRIFIPYGYDATRKYPLVLWLHGSDGRGSDNLKQITQDNQIGSHFWITTEVQLKFPAFVFAPQCPVGQYWSEPEFNQPSRWLEMAMEALGKIEKQYSIDPDRVYLAGQSMGGLGVYSLLQNYTGQWAAAIVISAYDTFSDVPAIAKVPLWVFQGDADSSVPVTQVRSMMAELKKAHANVRYTEYHRDGQDAWNKAFVEPDLLPWLMAQKRAGPRAAKLALAQLLHPAKIRE
jgi:predicted peptidase